MSVISLSRACMGVFALVSVFLCVHQLFPYLGFCVAENGGVSSIGWHSPLTEEEKAEIKTANDKLSSAALRVLAVAIKPLTEEDIEELKGCAGADERLHTVVDEPPRVCLKPQLFFKSCF